MAATASATVPPPPAPSKHFAADCLPFIDMSSLSQSELHSLSLVNPNPKTTTLTQPITIDRTHFNESAGSRRQTYSRPSPHHHHHRHRLAGLLPKSPNDFPSQNPDSDRIENHKIIKFLKKLLSSHPEFTQLDLIDFNSFTHLNDAVNFTKDPIYQVKKKRKRGRKVTSVVEDSERCVVNRNGEAIDLAKLATLEDPYKEELKRRTEGLISEEELLGFFRDLNGQWCSRRRKRRIVDAHEFGDFLPLDWKLLLGLKRKEGKAWVYCRRYISPSGQQFLSCKEVSAYLQSFAAAYGAQQVTGYASDNLHEVRKVVSESYAGISGKEEDQKQSSEQERTAALLGINNLELAEVQIQDLFECHKCSMSFDEKDTYLQHLLSFHQRTTRRYRIGSSVGDGVIVKDGKYECQFCHKIFHERRSYNGHVGIHVRNFVRGVEASPSSRMALQNRSDSPTKDEFPTRISKMDALIEIAQNSILETSMVPDYEPSNGYTSDKIVAPNQELLVSVSDHELKSDSTISDPETECGMVEESQELDLHEQKAEYMVIDEKTRETDDTGKMGLMIDLSAKEHCHNTYACPRETDCPLDFIDDIDKSAVGKARACELHSLGSLIDQKVSSTDSNMNLVGKDNQENCKAEEVDNTRSVEIEFSFGSESMADNVMQETREQQSMKDDEFQHDKTEPHNVILDKVENELTAMDQRHEETSGFQELRLEDVEQLKFSFVPEQEPISLPEVPINVDDNADMKGADGASIQFEPEVAVDTAGGEQLTVCVWCGVEFSLEAVDTETQSGSVGYMCPTCKARISGQLNAFGGDCS